MSAAARHISASGCNFAQALPKLADCPADRLRAPDNEGSEDGYKLFSVKFKGESGPCMPTHARSGPRGESAACS